MEEPGDKANRYLWVILIVTNDNLQETKMQDDHHHPGYNLKENPSKESDVSNWVTSGRTIPMNVDNYISGYGEDAASMNKSTETNAERPNN